MSYIQVTKMAIIKFSRVIILFFPMRVYYFIFGYECSHYSTFAVYMLYCLNLSDFVYAYPEVEYFILGYSFLPYCWFVLTYLLIWPVIRSLLSITSVFCLVVSSSSNSSSSSSSVNCQLIRLSPVYASIVPLRSVCTAVYNRLTYSQYVQPSDIASGSFIFHYALYSVRYYRFIISILYTSVQYSVMSFYINDDRTR